MKSCIFCKIVENKKPSLKIYEDEFVIAFALLKKDMLAKGHFLLAPKKHYENIYDIPEKELCNLMIAVKKISTRLKRLNVEGINILHASNEVAQQSVFHFHFHIIPRYKNDKLDLCPKTKYKPKENFEKIYLEFKKAVNEN